VGEGVVQAPGRWGGSGPKRHRVCQAASRGGVVVGEMSAQGLHVQAAAR
jgi:hypothetical protein